MPKIKGWTKIKSELINGRRVIVYKGVNAILKLQYMPEYSFGTGIEVESDEGTISVHSCRKTLVGYEHAAVAFMRDNPIIKDSLMCAVGETYTAKYI